MDYNDRMLEKWENKFLEPPEEIEEESSYKDYEVYYDRYGKKHYVEED